MASASRAPADDEQPLAAEHRGPRAEDRLHGGRSEGSGEAGRHRHGAHRVDGAQRREPDQQDVEPRHPLGAPQPGYDGQRQDDDQRGDPGLGVVGRVPLVEVLGPGAHAEHGREQAGTDRREQRDRRRQHRHRGHPGQGAAWVTAVEGEPERRDDADHDPDRPHPVAHRPDPRHRHEQPWRPPGVPGPLPGRDGHHDQDVADHLGPHRDARRARDQREDHEQRGDGRLGLASAGPVDDESEGQEQQPGQPRDAGQAEPVLGLRHHHLGQPLGRDPVRGREAATDPGSRSDQSPLRNSCPNLRWK